MAYSREQIIAAVIANDTRTLNRINKSELAKVLGGLAQQQMSFASVIDNTVQEEEEARTEDTGRTAVVRNISMEFSSQVGKTLNGIAIFAPVTDNMWQIFNWICGTWDSVGGVYRGGYVRLTNRNTFYTSSRQQGRRSGGFTYNQWVTLAEYMFRPITSAQHQVIIDLALRGDIRVAYQLENAFMQLEANRK